MLIKIFRHILFYLLLIPSGSYAQSAFFSSLQIDEKQESMPVHTLFNDHQGYLWVGSKGGLYKYNGKQFLNLLPDSLKDSLTITAIQEDKKHTLWFGCSNGFIGYLEKGKVVRFKPEEGLPVKAITDILFDSRNQIWFSTAEEGVYYIHNKRLYNFNTDDGLTDNYVYSLTLDEPGTVLAGTDRGLSLLSHSGDRKKVIPFSSRNGLPDNIVRAIYPAAQKGTFWIGMEDKGICLYDARQMKIIDRYVIPPWRFGAVNDILYLNKELWVATEDSGLIMISLEKDTLHYQTGMLPAFSKISALVSDDEGQLWFSQPGKIVRSSVMQLRFLQYAEKTPLKSIHALYTTSNQSIWIAQGKTLQQLQCTDNAWKIKSSYSFPGVPLQDITALYQDIHGIVWIGTIGAGIIRLNPVKNEWHLLKNNPVLENGHILSITGRENEVWISGLNGLTNYHLQSNDKINDVLSYTNYNKQSGIGSDYVYQVFIDHRNRVWFATDGAGVACKEGEKITSYKDKYGLKSDVIYGMTEDKEGILWLNTLDAGIVKFDGRTFTNFYTLPNTQSGSVSSIMSGDHGELVLMHKKGIDIVQLKTGKSFHYGKNNGIFQEQVNLNVISKVESGSIWIGTDSGFICVLPGTGQKQWEPKTIISGVLVFGNMADSTTNLELPYSDNNITVLFDGLHFSDPENVQFQYKLDGYHKDWISSSDRQVNFPRLAPGKYRFHVRSSSDGRFDQSPETTIQFIINPPFWKTWWFIIFASASAVLILYGAMKQRFTHLEKLNSLKQDKINAELQTLRAQVNPHFLFNSFNTLMGVIEENPEKALEYTEQLSAFYRNMLTYRETDLITLSEEAKLLQTYIYLQQQRFGPGLNYTFSVPEKDLHHYLMPPLTLQLLAENAIKHNTVSASTPLNLHILKEGDFLIINNSIHHKRKRETGEGMGLKNIMHRYALFSEKPVMIEENEQLFSVRLPLIKK